MASLSTLLRAEFAKLAPRPMTWILALIYASFLGLIYLTYIALLAANDLEGVNKADLMDLLYLPKGLDFGMGLMTSIGTTVMIILGAGSFGSEFGWGTIRTTLLMRASRMRLLAAKLIALAICGAIVVLAGFVAVIIGSVLAGVAGGNAPSVGDWLTSSFVADSVAYAIRSWWSVAFWSLLAAEVAIVTHSLGASIGISLASYIVGDLATSLLDQAGTIGDYAARLLPNAGVNALLKLNSVDPPHYVATDYLWITLNIVGYTVILAVVAVRRFRTMNILAASSAS